MNYLIATFAVFMSIVLATGQYFHSHNFGFENRPSFGLHSLISDFSNPSAYSGSLSSARDPRQDRGPVVFPPAPKDAVEESSGVIVGASGYGFVPPSGGQPSQYRSSLNPTYYSDSSIQLSTAPNIVNGIESGYFQRFSYF